MRKTFTVVLTFLFFLVTNLYAQSWRSNCASTPELVERFKADVFKLSLERLEYVGSPWKDSIDFPQIYKDTIAKAFYAFANMDYNPYKDTILSGFGGISAGTPIGEDPSYLSDVKPSNDSSSIFNLFQSVRYISVSVRNNADWASAWASGNYFATPNAALNKLMAENIASVSTCTEDYCISNTAIKFYTLRTNRPLNTSALITAFKKINNVEEARPQPYFGGGNEMGVDFTPNGLTLSFINSCADCDGGFEASTSWIFRARIFTNCQIDLIYVTPHFPTPPNGGQGALCNGSPTSDGQKYVYPCIEVVSTLPVKLSSLNAAVKNGTAIQLNFTATMQADARLYEIQHSADGTTFSKLVDLSAVISGSTSQQYSFTHNQPAAGNNYYRVKVIENNGNSFYSNIANGYIGTRPAIFSMQPNPARGSFQLVVKDVTVLNRAILVINSADGRLLLQQPLQKTNNQSINISSLPTGMYWVAMHTSNGTQVQKLFVQ